MGDISLCLVGCGGMGQRHLRGLYALHETGLSPFDLVAVCDLLPENANRAADEAERLFGRRPSVYLSMESAIADERITAFDIVTEVSSHLGVVLPAVATGRHVMCEKPLGLTVRSCRTMIEAAEAAGVVLATAENWRRDPPNRLAKAVLDSQVLGQPHLMVQNLLGGDNHIVITPWRHLKDRGAIGLDMGVHLTDIAQYYLGDFDTVYGRGFIAEPVRYRRDQAEMTSPGYRERLATMPDSVTATGEDSIVALFTMRSGVSVQMAYLPSGSGHRTHQRTVLGRAGSMDVPKDRTGGEVVVRLREGEFRGRGVVDLLPEFSLDEITSTLFGADGVVYDLPFAQADAAHLAIELHDFGAAIAVGRPPEVDGHLGMTAVAAVLAVYESSALGRPVSMEEVLSGAVSGYQDEIDAALGLLPVGSTTRSPS